MRTSFWSTLLGSTIPVGPIWRSWKWLQIGWKKNVRTACYSEKLHHISLSRSRTSPPTTNWEVVVNGVSNLFRWSEDFLCLHFAMRRCEWKSNVDWWDHCMDILGSLIRWRSAIITRLRSSDLQISSLTTSLSRQVQWVTEYTPNECILASRKTSIM